jgi:aldehyde:ferredoxin oxidoreductase
VSTLVAKTKGALQFADSLVACSFITHQDLPLLCQVVTAATGFDMTEEEGLNMGRRAVNLIRIFNVKLGLTPNLEQPSTRYCSTPEDGPTKGKNILPRWEQMMSDYYRLMGWDRKTGMPLPETLRELEHLIEPTL